MKFYYALFKKSDATIEVEFPDLPGCVTFADNWDKAVENATDVLAGWLANADPQFVVKSSSYNELEKIKGSLVPIMVDENMMESYQELKRFNVIFPINVLKRVDSYRKKIGLKRSRFLLKAAEEYLLKH